MKRLSMLVTLVLAMTLAAESPVSNASPGDPIHSSDIDQAGWDYRDWQHFGNYSYGSVSAESWVDLHWPCFNVTDEDDDCAIEDIRGHGLVEKQYKVLRTQIDFVRLGRYPSGVLAFNGTNVNSGSLPLIESRTPWVAVEKFCGEASFRAWNRVTFDVRWSDNRLSTGLSLLSDPTSDMVDLVCGTGIAAASPTQRLQIRSQVLGG